MSVSIAPSFITPKGVLDGASRLTLTVHASENGAACEAEGTVSGSTAQPLATKELSSEGCSSGVRFCGDLQVDRSDKERVFAAAAADANGQVIAVGCAAAVVDQDALPIEIRMQRFIAPAVCGNGALEPTEQCEPPGAAGDLVCDTQCHTKEIRLSTGSGAAGGTSTGSAGDKLQPSFTWPPGSGTTGKFVALFTDRSPPLGTEVTVRVLGEHLEPFTGLGPEVAQNSFFLPNDPGGAFPPAAEANNQAVPAAASLGSKYFIAYEDDAAGTIDIHLRSMDANLTAEQPRGAPLVVNEATAGAQTAPAIAASTNNLILVVWQEDQLSIASRVYNPQNRTFATQRTLSTGTNNRNPKVASVGANWVVVWQQGQNVVRRAVGADGNPIGNAERVNDAALSGIQETPVIAGLPDGRYAVAWNDRTSTDIYAQRFGSDTQPVAGDQAQPMNSVAREGDQKSPAIASMAAAGGSFVVAWTDAPTGHIRARLLGGSTGFLFNQVDGQAGPFQASVRDGRRRDHPTIAVGGAWPYIGIGWEDLTADDQHGIYVRRFPSPAP